MGGTALRGKVCPHIYQCFPEDENDSINNNKRGGSFNRDANNGWLFREWESG